MLRISDQGPTFGADPAEMLKKIGINVSPETIEQAKQAFSTARDILKKSKEKPAAQPPPASYIPVAPTTTQGVSTMTIVAIVGAVLAAGFVGYALLRK